MMVRRPSLQKRPAGQINSIYPRNALAVVSLCSVGRVCVFGSIIMNHNVISAVFDSRSEAEAAVSELRSAGVDNSSLSVVGREEGRTSVSDGSGDVTDDDAGKDAAKGALGGAGIGAILGIAALAIPGVGPLAAAGAIASSAIPGAAAIGAGAGAVAGGLGGYLKDHGVSDEDASYYENHINEGGIFVSVDTSAGNISSDDVRDILARNGGHSASHS